MRGGEGAEGYEGRGGAAVSDLKGEVVEERATGEAEHGRMVEREVEAVGIGGGCGLSGIGGMSTEAWQCVLGL